MLMTQRTTGDLEMITIEKFLRLGFSATNNEAEYEALLVGMTMV